MVSSANIGKEVPMKRRSQNYKQMYNGGEPVVKTRREPIPDPERKKEKPVRKGIRKKRRSSMVLRF